MLLKNNNSKKPLIIALVWQFVLYLRLPNFLWDAGFVMAWFASHGLHYYKDFDGGAYFPLPKLALLSITQIFGFDIKLTLYVALVEAIIAIFVVYNISKRFTSHKAVVASLLFYSFWFGYILKQNTFDESLIIGILILLMINSFITLIKEFDIKNVVFMGFYGSLAFYSQQMSLIPTAIILFSLILFEVLNKYGLKNIFKKVILPFISGFLPVSILMFSYFAIKGDLWEFVDGTILYYLDSSRYIFTSFTYNPRDLLMLASLSTPLILLGIHLLSRIKEVGKALGTLKIDTWQLVGIFLTLFITLVSFFFAVFHPRRFLFLLPTMAFASALVFDIYNKTSTKKIFNISFVILSILMTLYLIKFSLPWYWKYLKEGRQYEISTLSQPADYVGRAETWIKNNTNKDVRIHVLGPMFLYYETQRLPANNKTYSALPWTYEPFEKTKKIFLESKADYWLVDERLFKRFIEIGYEHQANFIRWLLDTDYKLVASFDWMSVYEKGY